MHKHLEYLLRMQEEARQRSEQRKTALLRLDEQSRVNALLRAQDRDQPQLPCFSLASKRHIEINIHILTKGE